MEDASTLGVLLSWVPWLLYLGISILVLQKLGRMNQNIERIAKALEDRDGVRSDPLT